MMNCCTEVEIKRGCTAEVGVNYLAATDGVGIVFSGRLMTPESRKSTREFAGASLWSLLLFTILHEFGHVLHVVPGTRYQFDKANLFYTRCLRLLDPRIRRQAGIVADNTDATEFYASLFAIMSLKNAEQAMKAEE